MHIEFWINRFLGIDKEFSGTKPKLCLIVGTLLSRPRGTQFLMANIFTPLPCIAFLMITLQCLAYLKNILSHLNNLSISISAKSI